MDANQECVTSIDTIAEQLRGQESALVAESKAIESRRREIARNIRSVRVALAALGVKNSRAFDSAANAKAALKTQEVLLWIEDLLTHEGSMSASQMRQKVEQRAKDTGRSLIGLHLRFAKAMRDPRFSNVNDIVSLGEIAAKSASKQGKN